MCLSCLAATNWCPLSLQAGAASCPGESLPTFKLEVITRGRLKRKLLEHGDCLLLHGMSGAGINCVTLIDTAPGTLFNVCTSTHACLCMCQYYLPTIAH